MSTHYKCSADVPTEMLADRLDELADVICKNRDRIAAEFTMRVPAECDRDADLVLAEAARRLREQDNVNQADGWVSVDDALPELDVPVWVQMGSVVTLGGRADDPDGWLWGVCYFAPWINKAGEWAADIECDDDYQVTAWHPLPEPPKVAGEDEK